MSTSIPDQINLSLIEYAAQVFKISVFGQILYKSANDPRASSKLGQ